MMFVDITNVTKAAAKPDLKPEDLAVIDLPTLLINSGGRNQARTSMSQWGLKGKAWGKRRTF